MEFLGIVIGAAIASAAWLYQRAWERQERRVLRYQEILDRLDAFTPSGLSNDEMNNVVIELRRLWLTAPDDVVVAGERFLDIAEGIDTDPSQAALGQCVIAMRRDATLSSAILPRFWKTSLTSQQFRLRRANKGSR
jgi:hypothetical protein